MKNITVSKWSVPAAAAVFAAVAAFAFTGTTANAATTMTVHVKQASLADHAADCAEGDVVAAHFILNQIGSARPDTIMVTTDAGTSSVGLTKLSGPTAHYLANTNGSLVTDATAVVPSTWTGQFVLSHYVCGTTTTTTTTSSSSSSTTSSGTPTS